jgi:hypothetical protein
VGRCVTTAPPAHPLITSEDPMDLLMIFFTLLFFCVAIAYTQACEKLK